MSSPQAGHVILTLFLAVIAQCSLSAAQGVITQTGTETIESYDSATEVLTVSVEYSYQWPSERTIRSFGVPPPEELIGEVSFSPTGTGGCTRTHARTIRCPSFTTSFSISYRYLQQVFATEDEKENFTYISSWGFHGRTANTTLDLFYPSSLIVCRDAPCNASRPEPNIDEPGHLKWVKENEYSRFLAHVRFQIEPLQCPSGTIWNSETQECASQCTEPTIVANPDLSTGSWETQMDGDGNSYLRLPVGSATPETAATWTPGITEDQYYAVLVKWPAGIENAASEAVFHIEHTHGVDAVNVDQRINGGRWHLLGFFVFQPEAGHNVSLTGPSPVLQTQQADEGQYLLAQSVLVMKPVDLLPILDLVLSDTIGLLPESPTSLGPVTQGVVLRPIDQIRQLGSFPTNISEEEICRTFPPLCKMEKLPGEGLKKPGRCSDETHEELQKIVEEECGKPSSCVGITDCEEIQENLENGKNCFESRLDIMEKCFLGGDNKHYGELIRRWGSIRTCEKRFNDQGCGDNGNLCRLYCPFFLGVFNYLDFVIGGNSCH